MRFRKRRAQGHFCFLEVTSADFDPRKADPIDPFRKKAATAQPRRSRRSRSTNEPPPSHLPPRHWQDAYNDQWRFDRWQRETEAREIHREPSK